MKNVKEMSSYIPAEEQKSVREVYIRVAVIDIIISAGIRNIYIWGRCKPVCSPQFVAEKNVQDRGELIFGVGQHPSKRIGKNKIRVRFKQMNTYNTNRKCM
jgi:hypothetical protein